MNHPTHHPTAQPWALHQGDCLQLMAEMPANSVDSIVTDPPYEIGFMGKAWDSTGIAYQVELWQEALRVLKPGGHLLAFGATRSYHRMAVAIEDAGFEIRDCLMWCYGSGFPKSLDVSKAVDKLDAKRARLARDFAYTAWMRSTGVTAKQIDVATGTRMGNHYTTHPTQPATPTRAMFEQIRPLVEANGHSVPDWVEAEVDVRTFESENEKARPVVGSKEMADTTKVRPGFTGAAHSPPEHVGARRTVDLTAAYTPEAQQWEGWGTALKPALEPIVMARKPLRGTVAQNVTAHGVGALNIDGCRIGANGAKTKAPAAGYGRKPTDTTYNLAGSSTFKTTGEDRHPDSRWPANLLLDESAAEVLDSQQLGASRYYYVAKPSKKERNAGLEGFEEKPKTHAYGAGLNSATKVRTKQQADEGVDRGTVANVHPTVKPIQLMRYLCRLVTPPGGVVLDPFTGSGTTGCAAVLEGLRFVGLELSAEYCQLAQARIAHWAAQPEQQRLPI